MRRSPMHEEDDRSGDSRLDGRKRGEGRHHGKLGRLRHRSELADQALAGIVPRSFILSQKSRFAVLRLRGVFAGPVRVMHAASAANALVARRRTARGGQSREVEQQMQRAVANGSTKERAGR